MEHIYTRDFRLLESSQTAMTRTLMVHRPPQCPSCHTHSHDERIDLEESYNPPIPSYNEENARKAMQESENIVVTARNSTSDEEDWEEKVNKFGWSVQQFKLFDRVARLLDMDRLARLTNTEKQHEPVHRRTVIDKSVSRFRQALASVTWETRLTQWLHVLLIENLPPCYLAIYIDILQTLHAKQPKLMNKMIFGTTLNVGHELLRPVLKKPWEPIVSHKNRKLPGQPYIVVVPSVPNFSQPTGRQQKWFSLFATMASVIPIQALPIKSSVMEKQSLQVLAENMVATTRTKIQQVRNTTPNRSIILVGFDAGASLAIQIGLVESVSSVICLGFSYNTYNGSRGTPDDHIVDIGCPVLFVIGQNSARASHEEIEMLRERMTTQTSLVVVGSADECLRVSKTKRKIEGVTQSMVDNMVADEIAEFATNCLLNPHRPKQNALPGQFSNGSSSSVTLDQGGSLAQRNEVDLPSQRKRKYTHDPKADYKYQKKSYNRRSTKPTPDINRSSQQHSQEALDVAIQSILPTTPEKHIKSNLCPEETVKYDVRESGNTQIISALASTPLLLPPLKRDTAQTPISSLGGSLQSRNVNVKLIESNQLIQLKPTAGTLQKFYSTKSSTKPVVSVMASNDPVVHSGEISSPPKFTIFRNTGAKPTVLSDGQETEVSVSKATKDLTEANIFDLPIVFADNDGYIQENSPEKPKQEVRQVSAAVATGVTTATSGSPPTGGDISGTVGAIQPTNNRFVTLQQAPAGVPVTIAKTKQIVNLVINKGSLKPIDASMIVPMGPKISRPLTITSSNLTAGTTSMAVVSSSASVPKFTKVLLTKPLTAGGSSGGVVKNLSELLSSGKVEFVSCAGVKQTAITGTPVTMPQAKFQSIVINPVVTNKLPEGGTSTPTENVTLTTSTASGNVPIIGGNKILIKTSPSGLISSSSATSLVGRNVTLKRMNILTTSTGIQQSSLTSTVVTTSTDDMEKDT
ncbi:KAT8 regulatory NSL complex subunit 3 [Anopheles nili]|uniref:KAT8 regulatory NSL complex subunit 3 n=1 Tax=Anopheles nili TaxID=185578 RepID=UPI00237A456C|nr:KAT8 regulatory NSL complex subunit 3 [Anopheles nili]